jgi:hypothetical protein
MCAIERKVPPTQDNEVGARVSATPKHTPGRTRALHTPPLQGQRRLCALLMLELSVSATSGVPHSGHEAPSWGDGALDGACQ